MRLYLLAPVVLGLAAGLAHPAVINVPGDYPTIKEAIQNASGGDLIEVEPGTYTENIDFSGKGITIRGKEGPYHTVIDGGSTGSVVKFTKSETSASVLEGFEITNGTGTFNLLSRAIVGGGIYCKDSSPVLQNLLIRNNLSDQGAGIYATGGTVVLDGVAMEGNTAAIAGGGLFVVAGTAALSGCRLEDNATVIADGGGIYGYQANIEVMDSRLIGNQSGYWGGGLAGLFDTNITLVNSVLAHNTAAISGGGLAGISGGSLGVVNSTFFGNEAVAAQAGAIQLSNITAAKAVNSIFWNDTAPLGPEISLDASDLDISYCDVEGGSAMIHVSSGNLTYGPGNISVQPVFVDEADGDFHLFPGSGGIDGGNNNASNLPAADFEGDDRINGGTVDMGADEFYSPYMYFTGLIMPNSNFKMKMIGTPNANPVFIYVGSGVLPAPIPTPYGDWYLEFPVKILQLLPIPSNGFIAYELTMPWNVPFPPGTTFPMQTLAGTALTPVAELTLQ
jgi:hypothetical protein